MISYDAMQRAVDIVGSSEHIKNKIASCLFKDSSHHAGVNYRPEAMAAHFTPDIRIGNSSQFIHSEVGCIYAAPFDTDGASLCITDPFCPNCAKAIAESGIRHVYIDHKGLNKDFAKRRGEDFESLSLLIMEKAGISVSILHRKERRIDPLVCPPIMTRPAAAAGIEFFDVDNDADMAGLLRGFRVRQQHGNWAFGIVKSNHQPDKHIGILVFESLPIGLTPQDFIEKKNFSKKYSLTIDPLNRLLFYIRRKGYGLAVPKLACNVFPSSRAMVNAVGYGIEGLIIGQDDADTVMEDKRRGADILQKNGILMIDRLY